MQDRPGWPLVRCAKHPRVQPGRQVARQEWVVHVRQCCAGLRFQHGKRNQQFLEQRCYAAPGDLHRHLPPQEVGQRNGSQHSVRGRHGAEWGGRLLHPQVCGQGVDVGADRRLVGRQRPQGEQPVHPRRFRPKQPRQGRHQGRSGGCIAQHGQVAVGAGKHLAAMRLHHALQQGGCNAAVVRPRAGRVQPG